MILLIKGENKRIKGDTERGRNPNIYLVRGRYKIRWNVEGVIRKIIFVAYSKDGSYW